MIETIIVVTVTIFVLAAVLQWADRSITKKINEDFSSKGGTLD